MECVRPPQVTWIDVPQSRAEPGACSTGAYVFSMFSMFSPNLLQVLPSGMAGFHSFWSPGMCICLPPNVPRHLLWQVCPWLTRYHHHRLCPLLMFYAPIIIKNMKNRFFCSQYSVQRISWNIDVTSFCSQYYEIYKYRCFDSVLSSLLAPWGHLGRYCHHASLLMPNFLQRHWRSNIFVFFIPYSL